MSKVCINCASEGATVCSCLPDAKDRRIAELERRVEKLTAARMDDIEAFVKLREAACYHEWFLHYENDNMEQCHRCGLWRDRQVDPVPLEESSDE